MNNTGIILLGIGILIYLIKEGIQLATKEKKTKLEYFSFIIVLILLITGGTLQYVDNLKKEKYSKDAGILTGKLKNESIINPVIKWGSSSITFSGNQSKNIPILGMPLDIWVEDGILKISTIIRNKDGKVIAKLEENEWKLNRNSLFDRNFDDIALEVINDNDEVVLQIKFDNDAIQISTIFYNDEGGGKFIEQLPNESGIIFGSFLNNETKILNVDRLFEYPSDLYPGKRKNN